MSGGRRVQRSVRLTVSAVVLALAAVVVVPALITGTGAAVAAVVALLAGVAASRIVYTEVVQTRAQAARDRASQARVFAATISRNLSAHADFTSLMSSRIGERDRTIVELHGTIRLAERRADEAESRVRREARRANEAQQRLAVLLDEVSAHQAALVAAEAAEAAEAAQAAGSAESDQLADLPTIVDLLAWEEQVTVTASEPELRKKA